MVLAAPAQAGDKPLYAAAPDWVVPAKPIDPAKLTDSDPALVVFDTQQRLVGAKTSSYVEIATRAQSPEMLAQMGSITVAWLPDQGELTVHRVEILRGAERIDLLAGGERFTVLRREAQLEQRVLSGQLTATMAAQGLRVGDVLRVAFTITQTDAALKGRVQTSAPLLALPARAMFARSRLSWPIGDAVAWKGYPDGYKPMVSDAGGFRTVEMILPLAKPAELPADAPARYNRLPLVEATSFAGWADVSRTMAPSYATDGLIAPGSPLAGEVARIKAANADPLHRATAALQLVQGQIRYLLMGMNGGNYVPQTPAQTWQLRYGDCKAKSLMLLAMLRALGIDADAVLVSTERGDGLPDRLPMPGAFDHVIVRAVIGGRAYWLDGTRMGADFAAIGNVPPFRYGLPLRTAGADLLPMPSAAPAQPDSVITVDLDQSASLDLPTPFTMTMKVRGEPAGAINVINTQAGPEQKREFVTGLVRTQVGEAQVADVAMTYDPANATATVTASGIVGSRWRRQQGRYRLVLDRMLADAGFEPDRSRAAWRAIPVATGMPETTERRTVIQLPSDGTGYRFDGPADLATGFAAWTIARTAVASARTLKVEERMEASGAEIGPDAISAERRKLGLAKAKLLTVVAPADTPKRWQLVASARKTNAFRKIDDMFAKVIAADPDEITGYESRVSYRLGIYDYKAALADLTKMLAIAATSQTYLRRAGVYQALGDRAKALADAREAQKLAPDSDAALNTVAALTAELGDTKAALAMLRERIDLGGEDRFAAISVQADVLADSGDVAGAVAALDGAIAEKPGDSYLLNSRCWLRGTHNVQLDGALKDCTKSIELADSPAAALDSRAMAYFRMERTDEALADLDAALDIAPNQAGSLFLRGLIRKRRALSGADEDLAAARLISPSIDAEFKRYGITA